MKFIEEGLKDAPVIMLIHGMGCSGEHSFRNTVKKLKNEYRTIIVCLDGYDSSEVPFSSISNQSEKIANYVIEKYNGKIHSILGMSMGGFITIDLLSRFNIECDKAILDSGYLKPWTRFNAKIMSKLVSWGFRKLIKGKSNLIIEKTMQTSMGYCFKKEDLCLDATKVTLKNSEYSCLTYQLPELSKLGNMSVEYWYGKKDKNMIEGMKELKKQLPNMKEICFGDYGHGEFMFEHSEEYADMVIKSVKNC